MVLSRPARLIFLLVLLPACASVNGPSANARVLGGIILRCDPKEASILVDDRYVGTAAGFAKSSMMLPEGLHRLEIRLDGYFPHFVEVNVSKGVRQIVEVKLRKVPF